MEALSFEGRSDLVLGERGGGKDQEVQVSVRIWFVNSVVGCAEESTLEGSCHSSCVKILGVGRTHLASATLLPARDQKTLVIPGPALLPKSRKAGQKWRRRKQKQHNATVQRIQT